MCLSRNTSRNNATTTTAVRKEVSCCQHKTRRNTIPVAVDNEVTTTSPPPYDFLDEKTPAYTPGNHNIELTPLATEEILLTEADLLKTLDSELLATTPGETKRLVLHNTSFWIPLHKRPTHITTSCTKDDLVYTSTPVGAATATCIITSLEGYQVAKISYSTNLSPVSPSVRLANSMHVIKVQPSNTFSSSRTFTTEDGQQYTWQFDQFWGWNMTLFLHRMVPDPFFAASDKKRLTLEMVPVATIRSVRNKGAAVVTTINRLMRFLDVKIGMVDEVVALTTGMVMLQKVKEKKKMQAVGTAVTMGWPIVWD